jgi:hypothetical protein
LARSGSSPDAPSLDLGELAMVDMLLTSPVVENTAIISKNL